MKTIEAGLMQGEKIIAAASQKVPRFTLFIIGLLLLPVAGLGLVLWAIAIFAHGQTLALTDRRLIYKKGRGSNFSEIRLAKIEAISVEQGLSQRLSKVATIVVHGVGGTKTKLMNISDAVPFRNAVAQAVEDYGQRDRRDAA